MKLINDININISNEPDSNNDSSNDINIITSIEPEAVITS